MELTLYDITQEHLTLMTLLEENGGEVTEELLQAIEINEQQLVEKSEGYGQFIHRLESEIEAGKRAIERANDYIKRREKLIEAIKSRMTEALLMYGVTKIDKPTVKVSFRKSESVLIEDPSRVPQEYYTTKIVSEISKTKIKEAIKEGHKVAGATLIEKQNIQIK